MRTLLVTAVVALALPISTARAQSKPTAQRGLTKEQVDRTVKSAAGSIKACFTKERAKHPDLAGKVTVYFKIAGTGVVAAARVDRTTLNNQAVERCVLRQIKQLTFPPSSDGATVRYPFIFSS